MKILRLSTLALLVGAIFPGMACSQSPTYGPPQRPPTGHDQDRGYDDRYDGDRYDGDRYGDDRYGDDRYQSGYGNQPRPWEDVGFFYEELEPYGDWVLTQDYGWAWFPRDVHPYWRPYTEGRWVVTDYGWTWVSYEPFGWATYHYGRWMRDERIGWLWVPGTIWGPAWVSWQYGGGYVGWAPLPPSVGFEIGIGIRLGGIDLGVSIRPNSYSFVRERSFLDSRVSGQLVSRVQNQTIIRSTTNITNYTYIDNRVVNRGVEPRRIEQATGRRVRALRIADAQAKTQAGLGESEVRIYRPERKKLEAVRSARRANAGQRAETPPEGRGVDKPQAQRREPTVLQVAPRSDRSPRIDPRQLERQERQAKEELERFQAEEQREIQKAHREEMKKERAQAERQKVQEQQKAELEALRQEQRNAAKQLEARLEARRQAALAKQEDAPRAKGEEKSDTPQRDDKNNQKDKEDDKKKDKKGKKDKPPKKDGGGFYPVLSSTPR